MPSKFMSSGYPGRQNPSNFIAEHGDIWYGICIWPICISYSYCILSQLLALSHSYLLEGWTVFSRVRKRNPWCSTSTFQQLLWHWCVINTVLATNTKPGTLWAAMRKVNSIPARPRTYRKPWLSLGQQKHFTPRQRYNASWLLLAAGVFQLNQFKFLLPWSRAFTQAKFCSWLLPPM